MSKNQSDIRDQTDSTDQSKLRFRFGYVLIGLSGVLWFSLFAIPWFPLSTAGKATAGAAMFVGVQITWWGGAALVGPRAIKNLFNWFRRKR